jgi:5'-deoxynucleotidase YfbR-like HD superfamily hydrolase
MSYITTVTGKHFYPLNPNQQDIDIEDIAHALSLICRANGHFKHFYSVAQHSIACAEEASARGYSLEVILGCLLHDASEAYLCDVTRPVKKHIPAYLQAEEKLQSVIWEHFIGRELTEAEQQQIFEIDDHILSMEFHLLMPEDLNEDYRKLQGACLCEFKDTREVKTQFIRLQRLLCCKIAVKEAEHLPRTGDDPDRLQRPIKETEPYSASDERKQDPDAEEI